MFAYRSLMHNTIQFLNQDSRNLTVEIDRIFELERKFALLQLDEEHRRNISYQNMTLRELQEQVPDVSRSIKIVFVFYLNLYWVKFTLV